jgi:hypothetical protein
MQRSMFNLRQQGAHGAPASDDTHRLTGSLILGKGDGDEK